MNFSSTTLRVEQLALDPQNPRLDKEASGDLAAMAAVIKKSGLKLLKLVSHIAEHGISPLERMMVHPIDDGLFLADEGNRRTCALRLLRDPSPAETIDPAFYKKLKRITDKATYRPDEIECVVIQDERDRKVWLDLRHLGENGGSGTIGWGATENARFTSRYGGKNRMEFGLNVMELVLSRCKVNPDEEEKIRNLPLTTLERMLGDPSVRKAIGVERAGPQVLFSVSDEQAVLSSLKALALDVANGVLTSRNTHKAEHRKDHVDSWNHRRKPGIHGEPVKPTPAHNIQPSPSTPTPVTNPTPNPANPAPHTPRSPASPDQRSKLVPVGCRLNITDKKVHRVFVELKKLDVEGFENAVSVLLRVFLELSVDAYLDRVSRTPHENTKLRLKMEMVADELEKASAATSTQLKPWRNAASSHTLFSLNVLHSYVHDRHGIPTRRELLQTWDRMEFFMNLLWP